MQGTVFIVSNVDLKEQVYCTLSYTWYFQIVLLNRLLTRACCLRSARAENDGCFGSITSVLGRPQRH